MEKLRTQTADFADLWANIEDFEPKNSPRITIQILPSSGLFLFGANRRTTFFSLHPFDSGEMLPESPLLDYSAWRDGQEIKPNGWSFQLKRNILSSDRKDIEALPHIFRQGAVWLVSDSAPAWAVTQESVIAHELAEFFHGLGNDHCKYSCDCAAGRDDDSHQIGKMMENAVRHSFGQTDTRVRVRRWFHPIVSSGHSPRGIGDLGLKSALDQVYTVRV